jgi:predicted permease
VNRELTVSLAGQTESLLGHYVSGGYFDGMGVGAVAGRTIQPTDDRPESSAVAVVSYGFAMRHFGSAPGALGQTIRVENHPHTIVGVAPEQFFGAEPGAVPDVYLPLVASEFTSKYRDDDHFYWLEVMGRLKTGVTLARAQAQLTPVFLRYANASAEDQQQKLSLPQLTLQEGATGLDSLRRQYAQPIYVLMAMVGVILVVACMNLANLLLARSAARTREIAVRLSLGASRWRIIRQLLTESVTLSAIGAAAGVVFASWGIGALTALLANGRDHFTLHARLDWRVLGVTLVLAVLTGILFGLAPAIQATRVDVAPALKDDSGREQPRRSPRFGVRGALVMAQVAFSLLLVVAAGLFDRTLASLRAIPLGFDRDHVLLFTIRPLTLGYEGPAATRLFETLQDRLRQVPGVIDVTLSGQALPAGGGSATRMSIAGTPSSN